jgi:LPS O-antigen subunit length determinant protein (WzzB/FepE family)
MPRETNVERLAREKAEEQARVDEAKAEYFPRLLMALEKATNIGWDISVKAEIFTVHDGNNWLKYEVAAAYTSYSIDLLFDLEHAIDIETRRLEEVKRKIAVKKQALSKLTEEERQVLGVNELY